MEDQIPERRAAFMPNYQINVGLLKKAPAHCKLMHCLPASCGVEATDEALDSPQSIIFDQAENRLHAEKGILTWLVYPRLKRPSAELRAYHTERIELFLDQWLTRLFLNYEREVGFMKVIVITGSTRGIGYGLADSFLALGCAVTVSGRTQQAVDKAVAELSARHGDDRVFGHPCDVTDFEQVQSLWNAAQARFDKIDIWINNAGLGNPQMDFWELLAEQIQAVVSTNLMGAMYGTKVALRGMLDQGFGALYNMEGLGSDGRKVEGLALYGSTKAGLRHLDECLAQETKGTPVLVGALRPGMVITDFVTRQFEDRPPEEWERAKRMFNIIADRVETVTPWLAQQVLANDKNGVCISWLSRWKVMGRFLTARFRKRNLFE